MVGRGRRSKEAGESGEATVHEAVGGREVIGRRDHASAGGASATDPVLRPLRPSIPPYQALVVDQPNGQTIRPG